VTTLLRFKDNKAMCFSSLRMDNGDPCFISVAQTGVRVKKSKSGMFGPILFDNKNVYESANYAKALCYLYPENMLPTGFTNNVLMAFTNSVFHCSQIAEVTIALNESIINAEKKSGQPIGELIVAPYIWTEN